MVRLCGFRNDGYPFELMIATYEAKDYAGLLGWITAMDDTQDSSCDLLLYKDGYHYRLYHGSFKGSTTSGYWNSINIEVTYFQGILVASYDSTNCSFSTTTPAGTMKKRMSSCIGSSVAKITNSV